MTRSRASRLIAAAAAVIVALAPVPALSCSFHFVKPERTVIDWLVEADSLALARPSPDDPFAFKAVETLRAGRAGAISAFVDTGTRARLRADPEAAMLFVAEDGGEWRAAVLVDARYRRVIDAALAAAPDWARAFGAERLAFAAALQDDPDPAIAELAIREFDKAPYELLRQLELRVPVERLITDLWTPQGYPFQQTRALLLGISGEDAARAEVRAFLERTRTWNWAENLGAFAAALVELDGPEGVAWLETAYLAGPDQPLDKVGQIIGALAIHSSAGDAAVRVPIADALARFLERRPAAAPLVAARFLERYDWSQAAAVSAAAGRRQVGELGNGFAVFAYLAGAHRAGAMSPCLRCGTTSPTEPPAMIASGASRDSFQFPE